MRLLTERHAAQQPHWPATGRHILAQYDDDSIVVYQAYRPEIGTWAAQHGHLGGPAFSLGRMSWVKPNFLWMMYRSGWGTKEGQEITLAIRIQRRAFDAILAAAVHSTCVDDLYGGEAGWKAAVARSDVRLQWDPDHGPGGAPLVRRAVQLGLRGAVLRDFASEWIVEVEDISSFVAEQRARRAEGGAELVTPRERVYPVEDGAVAKRLGIAAI